MTETNCGGRLRGAMAVELLRRATPRFTRVERGREAAGASTPVLISVTDFKPYRRRDVLGMVLAALRLRMGWYAIPGAVALWLWAIPFDSRHPRRLWASGSVSVWTDAEALHGFVQLPRHVDIMRQYRERGSLRSTTWASERYDAKEVLERARRWIEGQAA